MSQGDKWIRGTTIAVSVVALVAGFVSYRHALQVVCQHGETGWLAMAYPLTVDGLIYVSSMTLLDRARRGDGGSLAGLWRPGLGITATVTANITAGLRFGPVGAIVAAWPAVALVISYELLKLIIRSGAAPQDGGDVPGAGNGAPEWLHAAHQEFAEELAAGQMPGHREIRSRLRVRADRAQQGT
jgi:Protein of unknown function (DUF2637)